MPGRPKVAAAPGRRLLVRSYLFLSLSLIVVAYLLNTVFANAYPADDSDARIWQSFVAELLAPDRPPSSAFTFLVGGAAINVEPLADAAIVGLKNDELFQEVFDANTERFWLVPAASGGNVYRLGPLPTTQRSLWPQLLPALFYLSIFGVLFVWLRPLLTDVENLTAATERFANDYRQPLATAKGARQLDSLAEQIDQMSLRISTLVGAQTAMTSALSHEIRTPLARMRFALAIDDDAGAEAGHRESIIADIEQIDALVSAMLQYARLDDPEQVIRPVPVNAAEWLVQNIVPAQADGVTVMQRVTPNNAVANMDSGLMQLALSNLVENALRVAASTVIVSVLVSKGNCSLIVEDDGPGVAAEERDAIFSAYRQATDPKNRGGFGLGLAIVRRVAELHRGDAAVDESPSLGGARFRLSWPQSGA